MHCLHNVMDCRLILNVFMLDAILLILLLILCPKEGRGLPYSLIERYSKHLEVVSPQTLIDNKIRHIEITRKNIIHRMQRYIEKSSIKEGEPSEVGSYENKELNDDSKLMEPLLPTNTQEQPATDTYEHDDSLKVIPLQPISQKTSSDTSSGTRSRL